MANKDNNKEGFSKMSINWYPGHMAKTKKQIIEDLKLIDVVVEILDARTPMSSQNPDLQEWIRNKRKVVALSKSDLAEDDVNKKWIEYYKKQGVPAVLTDSNSGRGVEEALKEAKKISMDENAKLIEKGRVGKQTRVMIVGIPNVGKSSFINRASKKTSAVVGNKPGVTRQKQWISLKDNISLLDTPGMLWPKLDQDGVALNLAFTGTIKDDILPKEEIAYYLVKFLLENKRKCLIDRYSLDENLVEEILSNDNQMENENILEVMHIIGKKRGTIMSENQIDEERLANLILDEFRSGKLGRISLEEPKI